MTAATQYLSGKTITVYYDGLCHLCSREINHYKKMKGSEGIGFVDITAVHFDANKLGLDPVQIHRSLHVRDQHGSLKTGVDAFVCIWDQLSALKFLGSIAKVGAVHFVLNILYSGFVLVRPLLPRKSCENSPYCEYPKK